MAKNQVITGVVRLSYTYLAEKRRNDDGSEGVYETSVIVPKDDTETLDALKAAVKEAVEYGKTSKWGGTLPKNLRMPFHDGDEREDGDPNYANSISFTAKSGRKVFVVDKKGQPVLDPDAVYSGVYVKLILSPYPYNHGGNKGVGMGLEGVQIIRDGERLGGTGVSSFEQAASMFGVAENADTGAAEGADAGGGTDPLAGLGF